MKKTRIELKDAYKGYTLDQDKICSPEDTVKRFRERLKRVKLDILAGTMRIDSGRLDIPVYFSFCGRDAQQIIGTKKQMGKGGTPQQSEASAVMELAERFSFFSFCKDQSNFIFDEYRNLNEKPILSFDSIAKSVHDESDELNKARIVFERLPMRWSWAYSLTNDHEVLIPFDWFYTINEYNGPSAGNCVEEAIIQGICEVVERHVSSVISRNRLRRPGIRIESVTDSLCLEMIGKYRKIGVKLYITDFSLNTGIPSVGVLAYDPATFPDKSEIVWTAGTTPDPQKALSRALTEVAQLAGDFNSCSNYVASGLPKFKTLDEAEFVMNPAGWINISELPDISDDNIRIEIERAVSALSRIDLEVLLIDVMHPELQIPAFYTIIPGAHFRERAANTSVAMFCAKLLSQNLDPPVALERLKEMDRILPEKYYVKFFIGLSLLSMNQPSKALKYLKESLSLDPKDEDIPSIYSYMGVCLKEMEDYRDAIDVLRQAEQYDNERTDIYNLMGYCYFKLKDHRKAIECFMKVIKIDPSSAIDYANIAVNYRELGEKETAIRYYNLALKLDPEIEFAKEGLKKLLKQN